jgi:VIT1/CCC1 family predicted Fe2+/Mn2+ transporter
VAVQLTAKDALGAHLRDELHLSETTAARPVQAALTSAATFAAGAALPMLTVAIVPERMITVAVTAASLIFLGMLGAIAAVTGGAGVMKAVARVTFWGALAMAITAGIGKLFGTVV